MLDTREYMMSMRDLPCVCFPQAEGILRAWATPALQRDYGSDPVVTKIWNTTMTEVQHH